MLMFFVLLQSCHNSKVVTATNSDEHPIEMKEIIFADGPQTVVYKTINDYSDYIPVTMNANKTQIVSYPAPSDIYYNGKLAKPTILNDGYWLDNRGINENTVFLKYTYEEYAQLKSAPSLEEMKKNTLNLYPFIEMIHCGVRYQYTNEVAELNQLIKEGFPNCKRIEFAIVRMPD